jgi:archaellum component FlaF (FlaF/FlaG flagellin family)
MMEGMNMGNNAKVILMGLAFFALGSLGVATAVTTNDRPDIYTAPGSTVQRTVNGETQTGVVESVTEDGEVRRVIRWRTKEGETVTETVEGPTRYRTLGGEEILVPGPTTTVHQTNTVRDTHTVHDPGETVTLPGETVTLPGETVTVTVTVTGDPGTAGAP